MMPGSTARDDLRPEAVDGLAGANMMPVDREIDARDLPVRGVLPRAINGTLFRNGPNPQFPAGPHAHWFTGDGMVHRFEFDNGRVSYRNRWVRTPRFAAERAAGHPVTGGGPGGGVGSIRGGSANTNIVWHGGKLMALEEAHLPVAMDPATLDTLGPDDLKGALRAPFTAHPRVDPVTGDLIFFGYSADGPLGAGMTFGRVSATGVVMQYEAFTAPYAAMVHDFVVTQRFVVFPIMPLTARLEHLAASGLPYAWEPALGSWFGVMPRDGSVKDVRWLQVDARYAYHVMNAWDDGGLIQADVMEFPQPALFPNADGSPVDPGLTRARLTRWSIDPAPGANPFRSVALDDLSGEFPRIDDRFATLAYRHGWYACCGPGRNSGFDAIAHIDHARGRRATFVLPIGDVPSEPVFVPASATAEEGDGWVLVVVWRGTEARSELLLLDALDVSAGPVAIVELPQRVPFGFHGNFVAAG